VAGWREYEPGRWELHVGRATCVVERRTHDAEWWIAGDDVRCSECGEYETEVDYGSRAVDVDVAQLAAEDAILAVLTEAAAALGKRVVS
jgi:hypothetical protein